jgi:hypothetical protein
MGASQSVEAVPPLAPLDEPEPEEVEEEEPEEEPLVMDWFWPFV